MINITLYEKHNFIRLRYDLTYLLDLKKEFSYTKPIDGHTKVIKQILDPAIEVFWIKSFDDDKQSYYVSCGTVVFLNSKEKPMENILESTRKIEINMLGSSILETLVNDVNTRLVNGKLNESLIRKVWSDIDDKDIIDVVSIDKTISSKIYKKIDTLSFHYPNYSDIWNILADEYRLNELIPKNEVKTKLLKF